MSRKLCADCGRVLNSNPDSNSIDASMEMMDSETHITRNKDTGETTVEMRPVSICVVCLGKRTGRPLL